MKNPKLIRVDHLLAYLMMYGGYTIIILFYMSLLLWMEVAGLLLTGAFTLPLIIIYFYISNIAAAAAGLRGPAVIVNTIMLVLLVTVGIVFYVETYDGHMEFL